MLVNRSGVPLQPISKDAATKMTFPPVSGAIENSSSTFWTPYSKSPALITVVSCAKHSLAVAEERS